MSKKKGFIAIFLFLSIFIPLISSNVRAHPPEAMVLDYNLNTQALNVSIFHSVANPGSHYVNTVRVTVNGSTVVSEVYNSQPDPDLFSYTYNFAASNGSRIEAVATCSVGGSIAACIIVGVGSCGQTGGGGQIPGYSRFLIITLITVLVVLPIIYRKLHRKKIPNT
ncbi:MAG: hypothetical protein ACXAAI_10340 [Promethearchaeota archaeon]|jgi:hypothetical protein